MIYESSKSLTKQAHQGQKNYSIYTEHIISQYNIAGTQQSLGIPIHAI